MMVQQIAEKQNALSREEFELNVSYPGNRSLALHLKSLWLSVWRMMVLTNRSRDGYAATLRFAANSEFRR